MNKLILLCPLFSLFHCKTEKKVTSPDLEMRVIYLDPKEEQITLMYQDSCKENDSIKKLVILNNVYDSMWVYCFNYCLNGTPLLTYDGVQHYQNDTLLSRSFINAKAGDPVLIEKGHEKVVFFRARTNLKAQKHLYTFWFDSDSAGVKRARESHYTDSLEERKR
jgi:hypothetical protein